MEFYWLSKVFEHQKKHNLTKCILTYMQQKQNFYEIIHNIFGRLKILTNF